MNCEPEARSHSHRLTLSQGRRVSRLWKCEVGATENILTSWKHKRVSSGFLSQSSLLLSHLCKFPPPSHSLCLTPSPPPDAYHPSYTCIETSLAHPVGPSRANDRAAQRKSNFRQRRNKKRSTFHPFCFCDKPNLSSTSAAGTQNHSLEPFVVWFGFPDVIILFLEDKTPRRQGSILAAKPVSWMKYERCPIFFAMEKKTYFM